MAATEEKVRIGVIGVGVMGREHIRNMALLHRRVTLTALADDFEASRREAEALLEELGMEAVVLADYHELLARDDVDAVVVATPNFHHVEVIRAAAGRGKAVLVEKPLCTTIADCMEVVKLTRDAPELWWVGMEYRYIPSIARLVEEVATGSIGQLRMLAIREHRFPFLAKVRNWNRFNKNTGGTLVEKCCHFFDLMLLIVPSAPVRVFASGAQDVNHLNESDPDGQRADILDNAYVVVDFAGGERACLDLCMFAEASRNQEEIIAVGDGGKVEAFAPAHGATKLDPGTPNLLIGKRDRAATSGVEPPKPVEVESHHISIDPALMAAGHHCGATFHELAAFVDAVQARTAPAVGMEDGLRAVALGLAAQMSIAERRVVEMHELGLPEACWGRGGSRRPGSVGSNLADLGKPTPDEDGFRVAVFSRDVSRTQSLEKIAETSPR